MHPRAKQFPPSIFLSTKKRSAQGSICFINPRVKEIRNEASSCPEIFSRTVCFYYVASSPSSPLPHLLDGHSKLVGCSFIDPRVRKFRNETSSCPEIFSRNLRFCFVASSPGSPLPHLLDGHRKLVRCSTIPARSCPGPVRYPWGSIVGCRFSDNMSGFVEMATMMLMCSKLGMDEDCLYYCS